MQDSTPTSTGRYFDIDTYIQQNNVSPDLETASLDGHFDIQDINDALRDAGPDILEQITETKYVRTNGLSWPPSKWQVASIILVTYFCFTTHAMFSNFIIYLCVLLIMDLDVIVMAVAMRVTVIRDPSSRALQTKEHVEKSNKSSMVCIICQDPMYEGVKHCKECNKCVPNFDHHCYIANNCIGAANYIPFRVLLGSALIYLVFVILLSCTVLLIYFVSGMATMFIGFPINANVWITLNCVNIVLTLAPLYEFIILCFTQVNAYTLGVTQYQYFVMRSTQLRAQMEERRLKCVKGKHSASPRAETSIAPISCWQRYLCCCNRSQQVSIGPEQTPVTQPNAPTAHAQQHSHSEDEPTQLDEQPPKSSTQLIRAES